jgi:hypothetical protein
MSRISSASTRGAFIGKASSLRSSRLSLKRQSFPFFLEAIAVVHRQVTRAAELGLLASPFADLHIHVRRRD